MEECVVIGQREKRQIKAHRDGEREKEREDVKEKNEEGRAGPSIATPSPTLSPCFATTPPCRTLDHRQPIKPDFGPSPAHLARLWTIASLFSHFGPSPAIVALQLFLLTPRQQPPRWLLGPRLYQILLPGLTFSKTLDSLGTSTSSNPPPGWPIYLARRWTSLGTSTIYITALLPGLPFSQTLELSWDLDYVTSSSRVSVLARLFRTSLRTFDYSHYMGIMASFFLKKFGESSEKPKCPLKTKKKKKNACYGAL